MKRPALAIGLVLLTACEDPYRPPPPPAGSVVCDPLVVAPEPIALEIVVAAGRAADGQLFVVDRTRPRAENAIGERRAFVSNGNTLKRVKIAGAGEVETELILSLNDAADLQIKIERPTFDGVATRMGVYRFPLGETKNFDLDREGEVLSLVSAAELGGFALENFTSLDVMYAATTGDGRELLALQPAAGITPEKLRVFLGPADRMVERTIATATFSSFASLVFDVDGTQTTATLTYPLSSADFGAARLEQGSRTVTPLTPLPGSPGVVDGPTGRAPATTFTNGRTFLCF